MAFFQWQQIDPTDTSLAQAMKDAFAAADLDPDGEETFASDTNSDFNAVAGSAHWSGLDIAGRPQGMVTFAWWTDAVGLRHWYIEGHAYRHHGEPEPLWRCWRGQPPHPLWVIAPRHVVQPGEEVGKNFLVLCDCGEIGTPESLAWMGTCCGPCHDRRMEDAAWVPPPPRAYSAQQSSVSGLAFLDEERIVTCGYRDSEICLRETQTIRHFTLGEPDEGGAMGLALLPGDCVVVVAFNRSRVRCHDLVEDVTIWHSHCPGELMGLTASPTGTWVAVDAVGQVFLLQADSGEGETLSQSLAECAFSYDPEMLYSFDHDERAILSIDPVSQEIFETGLQFGEPEEDDCYSLVCSPVQRLIASGGDHGRVRLGDPEQGRWLWIQDGPWGLVANLAFAPDGQVLASGHGSTLVFWDVATGNYLGKLTLPGEGLQSFAFSPGGEVLAVGDSQGVVRLLPWRGLLAYHE